MSLILGLALCLGLPDRGGAIQAPILASLNSGVIAAAATAEANKRAGEFIVKAEAEQQAMAVKSTFASWNYESNITEETKEPYLKLQKDSSKLTKQHGKEAQAFDISIIQVTVQKCFPTQMSWVRSLVQTLVTGNV